MKASINQALSALQAREQAAATEQAEAQRQLVGQTRQLLQKHADDLQLLSSAARQRTEKALDRLAGDAEKAGLLMQTRLRKSFLVPLLLLLTASLTLILAAGISAWSMVRSAQTEVEALNAQARATRAQIESINTEFCNSPAGRRSCRPARQFQ